MLKVKIKDKPNHVSSRIKGYHTNLLESIILLDIVLSNLKNEYNLSSKQILTYLTEYRKNLKEVK